MIQISKLCLQFVRLYYNITLDSDAKQSETDIAQCISDKENHMSEGMYDYMALLN